MSLYFHRTALKRLTVNLISQIDAFRSFADLLEYPEQSGERREFCLRKLAAIENAVAIITASRDEILAVLDSIHSQYAETKKSEKKEFLEEFQSIENEISYDKTISESEALLTALKTRISEIKHENSMIVTERFQRAHRIKPEGGIPVEDGSDNSSCSDMQIDVNSEEVAVKAPESCEVRLNYTPRRDTAQSPENLPQQHNTVADSAPIANRENAETVQVCASIKPPRAKIPQFSGNIEDFQAYWAVFKALVHDNTTLNDTEKMILLQESLTGGAANTIKGIKMIPQNYMWMVETIKKKYDNLTSARANIIKRLISLSTARDSAKSCEMVFDTVRSLVNEMTSSGYNISEVQDPMWIETILKKFPRKIVEAFLRENTRNESYTVGETLSQLEVVILRDAYIDERLSHQKDREPHRNNLHTTYICNLCEKPNHRSHQCRTVRDATARRKVVMEKGLCWKCFSAEHSSNDCKRPDCKRCGKLHNESLCIQREKANPAEKLHANKRTVTQTSMHVRPRPMVVQAQGIERRSLLTDSSVVQTHLLDDSSTPESSERIVSHSASPISTNEQIVLMTAEGLVWNYYSSQYERALFFFDTGAQVSLILQATAAHLALPVLKTEQYSLSGISGISETFLSHQVMLKVQTAQGREVEFAMKTKPTITAGFPAVFVTERDTHFLEKHNIFLTNTRMKGELQLPHVLIGLDLYNSFISENTPPIQLPTGLRVARTLFGFAAYGRGRVRTDSYCASTMTCNTMISDSAMLNNMFELEGLGISSKEGADDEDTHRYLAKYVKLLHYDEKGVTAPFPLKANVVDLSDNYNMALRRLIAQLKHLEQHPEQKKWYVKIINQYLEDGVIEEVIEPVSDSAGTYYMPHSGVWREHKSTPLRIVFDASSKQKGHLSLNEVIYTGASFVNKIHDILVASREKPIILIADIQAAFTQIRIHKSHRDLCRFLWVRNPEKPPTQSNLIEFRWKRVPFGITSSPSMLNMVLTAHLQHYPTPLGNEILSQLYVDNVLIGAHSKEEAIEKYKESKALFSKIGMNLRAFVSNCVNDEIDERDRALYAPMKLLGVDYDPVSDEYSLTAKFLNNPKVKRDFLRQHHSIYDPIGLCAPLMVGQKHLLRKMFEENLDWGSAVSQEFAEEWRKITKIIDNFHVQIPRRFFVTSSKQAKPSLWVFADASNRAMAVCGYLENNNASEISCLVSGKTKLAPQRRALTTPQLELLAILLAIRLAESIARPIRYELHAVNIASDSLIALSWIRSSRKVPLFVANQRDRIKTIMNRLIAFGCPCHLYHVPGEKNPADAGTRGATSSQLKKLQWINGPQWLLNRNERSSLTNIESIDPWDLDVVEQQEVVLTQTQCHRRNIEVEPNPIIDLNRFSSYNKALRVLSYVGKFIAILKAKSFEEKENQHSNEHALKFSTTMAITASDLDEAERLLLKLEHESVNLEDLQKRHREKRPFRDEKGIIRCRSRLQNANLPYDTRNPIYIASHSEMMRLILLDLHKDNAHCGKHHLLTLARQRFWMNKPSKCLQSIIKRCVICQKAQSLPFQAPEMADLPQDRVVQAKPFQNTGCDLLGPYMLNDNSKVYVCIFTCLTTRALHLEVVENLSAEAFLSSFVRFVSRRGTPRVMRTDCGTNFSLGQKVIDTLFSCDNNEENSMMNYCTRKRIKWLFNPPGAPWMGGVWERLVQSIKLALQKSVGRRKLSFSDLTTTIIRIEAILNTRPLTAISTTDTCAYPLRPVEFLMGNVSFSLPLTNSADSDDKDPTYDPECIQTVAQAKEALQYSEQIADRFWDVWKVEYLTVLRDTQKSLFKTRRTNARAFPEVGEIVLIEQELLPRGHWPIGKVTELVKSADGLFRSAIIKLSHTSSTIQRPITKLYPLELRSHPSESMQKQTLKADAEKSIPPTAEKGSKRRTAGTTKKVTRLTFAPQQKIQPPRCSKTKANKALRQLAQNEDEENAEGMERELSVLTTTRGKSYSPTLLMLAILSLVKGMDATTIYCKEGMVNIYPPPTPFQLCFDDNCRTFNNSPSVMQYELAPYPRTLDYRITLQSEKVVEQRNCEATPFCDHAAHFLSKTLIGNPHCWPLGAIVSVGVICYCAITFALLVLWLLRGKRKKDNTTMSNTTNISLSVITTERQNAPFSLATFRPASLASTALILSFAISLLAISSSACQNGYMRHSIDLVCSERSECHYEYRREVLFNDIQTSLCIQLRHRNVSVGLITIERVSEVLSCEKTDLFWTRETYHRMDYVTRCLGMGSCRTDRCESMKSTEIIPELNDSAPYPGYSSCSTQCSGIRCMCIIPWIAPWRACTFYRISHIPTTFQAYEVFKCAAWKPTVTLNVTVEFYNIRESGTISLTPYYTKEFAQFNFTVISVQTPQFALHQKYAQGDNETLVIPNEHIFPVMCQNYEQAVSNFSQCVNTRYCDCEVGSSIPTCRCPYNTLAELRSNNDYILPKSSPHITVYGAQRKLFAKYNKGETTVAIISTTKLESAHLNIDSPCSIDVKDLKGCYNCDQGSSLEIACQASSVSWATIDCMNNIFSIRCSPNTTVTSVKLAFDRAVIDGYCRTNCGGKNVTTKLRGILRYVTYSGEADIFLRATSTNVPQLDWLRDFHLPDMSPMWMILLGHWKVTLGTIITLVLLIILTYLFGPAILLALVKMIVAITISLGKLAVHLLELAVSSLRTTVHHVKNRATSIRNSSDA